MIKVGFRKPEVFYFKNIKMCWALKSRAASLKSVVGLVWRAEVSFFEGWGGGLRKMGWGLVLNCGTQCDTRLFLHVCRELWYLRTMLTNRIREKPVLCVSATMPPISGYKLHHCSTTAVAIVQSECSKTVQGSRIPIPCGTADAHIPNGRSKELSRSC